MNNIHLRQHGFMYLRVDHLVKTKKELKNLKKQKIQDIFIKTNLTKLIFNMIWLL